MEAIADALVYAVTYINLRGAMTGCATMAMKAHWSRLQDSSATPRLKNKIPWPPLSRGRLQRNSVKNLFEITKRGWMTCLSTARTEKNSQLGFFERP